MSSILRASFAQLLQSPSLFCNLEKKEFTCVKSDPVTLLLHCCFSELRVCLSLSCYDRTPQTGWLKQTFFSLTVLEPGNAGYSFFS